MSAHSCEQVQLRGGMPARVTEVTEQEVTPRPARATVRPADAAGDGGSTRSHCSTTALAGAGVHACGHVPTKNLLCFLLSSADGISHQDLHHMPCVALECLPTGRSSFSAARFFWLRYLARAETYLAVPGAKTQIVLDLNHELAGQTLTFDVELMKLTKARRSRKAAAMPWLPVPSTDPASGAGITSLPT